MDDRERTTGHQLEHPEPGGQRVAALLHRARWVRRPGVAEGLAMLVLLPLLIANALRAFDTGERLLGLLNLLGCFLVVGSAFLLDHIARARLGRGHQRAAPTARPAPRAVPAAARSTPGPNLGAGEDLLPSGVEGGVIPDTVIPPMPQPRSPIAPSVTGNEPVDDRR